MFSGLSKMVSQLSRSKRSPEYIVSRDPQPEPEPEEYNAARVYTGTLYGGSDGWGGTFQEELYYEIKSGKVSVKRLRPFILNGGKQGTFQTFVIYPVTETAVIELCSWKHSKQIKLRKCHSGEQSIMYKQRI